MIDETAEILATWERERREAEADYTLTLRPLASGRPVPIRLRQALKYLLRSQQLRCVRIERAGPDGRNEQPHRAGGG